jgi:cytochrome P450
MSLKTLFLVTMRRKALKDFVLSDGTRIPKGSFVSADAHGRHHDPALYPNPDVFDPFRFVGENGSTSANDIFSGGADYLPFSHGNHIW